jgi:hypothetical protein
LTRRGEGGGPGTEAATPVAGRDTNEAIGAPHDGRGGCASPLSCGERLALRQDMTISREAFVRNLPGAVAHVPYRTQGDEFVHEDASRGWRIRISRLPDRAIASLVLERHAVEIHLRGYDARSERAFLDRFERHFRRGGG